MATVEDVEALAVVLCCDCCRDRCAEKETQTTEQIEAYGHVKFCSIEANRGPTII